ncbi:MAG: squalene--hopene cyclase [Planctomycetota bacterium]|nr:MAG: squalene--hopene cyclase [Planctomycetota bacterium]
MVDSDRLLAAYETARCDLLAESTADGHWIGQLSSSALSTATAISALAIVERHAPTVAGRIVDEQRECALSELIMTSLRWLARNQNPDGGWGDTDKSESNIATTMLVRAAFALTCVPAKNQGMLERADAYIAAHGGAKGLKRRYGKDKTFAVPILTNCALAGLVDWSHVPSLPFELACFPQKAWKFLRLPVVSYAIPALVAIGQTKYFHRKPRNPLARLLRKLTVDKSLAVVETMQPESGGFLEAAPLTSFVVMSLASSGRADHPIVQKGVEFLLASVRADGSWPIDTNLATWNTTLSLNALAAGGEDLRETRSLDWLLECQHRRVHPYTGAEPGGWAWTDLSGGVPDVDDTSGALLALSAWLQGDESVGDRVVPAAAAGAHWLLDLQNSDGGWPTFCRGWGTMPFDRSGSDLTAHALRALCAWRPILAEQDAVPSQERIDRDIRIGRALDIGLRYLVASQHASGYWEPLWFGNQHREGERNPVYGTAKVLMAFRDLDCLDVVPVRRGLDWLVSAQLAGGGFGGPRDPHTRKGQASVEETALAVEALTSCGGAQAHEAAGLKGLTWLVDAVEANRHGESSPIGFYFAKLWYYERLYPLVSTVSALGHAARRHLPPSVPRTVVHSGKQ